MYLFNDQNELTIPIKCKLCLAELQFKITSDEYKEIKQFPIQREFVHGTPAHKLIAFFNKSLEVENFTIEEILQKEVSYSKELTRQVLSEIELTDEEVELYFLTTGRDAVSIGEMEILSKNKTKEQCELIAKKFVDKGLFKEIIGATPHYQALPPYAALVSQLSKFNKYISDIKTNVPPQLIEMFSQMEAQTDGLNNVKEFESFIEKLKNSLTSQMVGQKKEFDNIIVEIEKIGKIIQIISTLDKDTTIIMDSQITELTKQFEDINTKISSSMTQQIDGLSLQFEDMNVKIDKGMKSQISDMTGQFTDIETKLGETMKSQIANLTNQFQDTKVKISENLQKLRLGVIQQTVDQVIEKVFNARLDELTETLNRQINAIQKVARDGLNSTTQKFNVHSQEIQAASKDGLVKTTIGLKRLLSLIQKVSSDGLTKMTDRFNNQFVAKLKNSVTETVKSVNEISSSTTKSGESIKSVFADVSKNFSKAVIMAEENLSGISETIFKAVGGLRTVFTDKVIATLNDVLANILKRLEVSEITTREFWDQAKKSSLFTMKDIWFIRSKESAAAHIKDEITKAKMRILIVAPNITDIDLPALKACPVHTNIRISAGIDLSNPTHASIIDQLNAMQNVTYRQRDLQNLWGINRDYEEVIVCVLSQAEVGEEVITEIAGIGSIIPEHIKIFVPILEEAWLGSHKEILAVAPKAVVQKISKAKATTSSAPISQPKPELQTPPPLREPTSAPIAKSTSFKPKDLQPITPTEPMSKSPELKRPSVKELLKTHASITSVKPLKEPEGLKPIIAPLGGEEESPPLREPPREIEPAPLKMPPQEQAPSKVAAPSAAMSVSNATAFDEAINFFKNPKDILNKNTGFEISLLLNKVHEYVLKTQGYSTVLDPIVKASQELANVQGPLGKGEKGELEKKISFWKKKLKL